MVNELCRNHHEYACANIDDIAIFSESWGDHIRHVKAVLRAIQDAGLIVNLVKCKLAQSQVISDTKWDQVYTHSDRVCAIQQLRPP